MPKVFDRLSCKMTPKRQKLSQSSVSRDRSSRCYFYLNLDEQQKTDIGQFFSIDKSLMSASRAGTCHTREYERVRTENNRIQKLLLSEYCEFSDTVLVESPFAETTRRGHGLRQVALGLTPHRLIVASDVFKKTSNHFLCPPDLDASIESFELVSVYPLECVTLSIFARRRRKTLKARLIDGRTNFYELGGIHRREAFWKVWCDQVERLLIRKSKNSSLSETSADSSSSTTTVYFLSSEIEVANDLSGKKRKDVYRVWAHYGGAGDGTHPTWPHKDLYLGPSYNELVFGYYAPVPVRFAGASLEELRSTLADHSPKRITNQKPCQSSPKCHNIKYNREAHRGDGMCDVLFIREENHQILGSCNCSSCDQHKSQEKMIKTRWKKKSSKILKRTRDTSIESLEKEPRESAFKKGKQTNILVSKISRFGFGVPEKCSSALVLGPSRRQCLNRTLKRGQNALNIYELIENSVRMWEGREKGVSWPTKRQRHSRRYGLTTAAYFLRALGPWSVQSGERESVQGRRTLSAVNVRRECVEPELRLPVSRRHLVASVSCSALEPGGCSQIGPAARGQVILFWTPEYWYRPRAAITAYRELRRHLASIRDFRQKQEHHKTEKRFFHVRKRTLPGMLMIESSVSLEERSDSLLKRIFSTSGARKRKDPRKNEFKEDSTTYQLRKLLSLQMRVTVWELDSSTLARQLTMIDRDLFIRIPASEIEIVVFHKSSRNAPNLGAWIAFSHRISCLTISVILGMKKIDMRTRIMARFINVANKCFSVGNFHSCRSILAGLQAPPIYRLSRSWSYLRRHHANRYIVMEKLCKIYKNLESGLYRRAWSKAKRNPPCMPYIGDLVIRILGLDILRCCTSTHSRYLLSKKATFLTSASSLKNNSMKFSIHSNEAANEQKQGLSTRILAATLAKFKSIKHRNVADEREDHSSQSQQQHLARKYFYRWNYITLESKMKKYDEEKLKEMNRRKKRVYDLTTWLYDCQRFARGYNFPKHSLACEFLLKARYKEDRENFFLSLKLEPPNI